MMQLLKMMRAAKIQPDVIAYTTAIKVSLFTVYVQTVVLNRFAP